MFSPNLLVCAVSVKREKSQEEPEHIKIIELWEIFCNLHFGCAAIIIF